MLKHSTWRTTKFDPRSLEGAVQAKLTGERLTIGEDDRGGEMELADDWRQNASQEALDVRWRGQTWLARAPAVCVAAGGATAKKRRCDAPAHAGGTSGTSSSSSSGAVPRALTPLETTLSRTTLIHRGCCALHTTFTTSTGTSTFTTSTPGERLENNAHRRYRPYRGWTACGIPRRRRRRRRASADTGARRVASGGRGSTTGFAPLAHDDRASVE